MTLVALASLAVPVGSASAYVRASISRPQYDRALNDGTCPPPCTVTMTSQSIDPSDPSGQMLPASEQWDWNWDFGSFNPTSFGRSSSHTYTIDGTYHPKFRAVGHDGTTAELYAVVSIYTPPPPGFSGYRSSFSQGWLKKGTEVIYRASSFVSGFATERHTCDGYVRLERKIARRWKPYKSTSVKCPGAGSISREAIFTDLRVATRGLKTALKHYRVRVVAQVAVRRSGKVRYQQRVVRPVRLNQQYRYPGS